MLQWEKTERTACGRGEPHAGEKRNHLGPGGGAAGGRHFVLCPGDALGCLGGDPRRLPHGAGGEAATPIADKLADISGYFLLALCAIYLEKYLLTVTAYAAFRLLVPAACLLLAAWLLAGRDWLRKAGWKLLVFGLAIVLVIPASVKVSGLIEDTYRLSMEETLQQAKDTTQAVEDSAQSGETETDQGFLGGLFSKVTEGISQAASGLADRVGQMLNRFLEALAVMLVTSCLIPILVLLFFVWLVKFIWGIDLPAPKPLPGRPPRHQERSPQ